MYIMFNLVEYSTRINPASPEHERGHNRKSVIISSTYITLASLTEQIIRNTVVEKGDQIRSNLELSLV